MQLLIYSQAFIWTINSLSGPERRHIITSGQGARGKFHRAMTG